MFAPTLTRFAVILTAAVSLPLTPVTAQTVSPNSDGGWGYVAVVAIVLFILVGGFLLRRVLPSASEVAEAYDAFWEKMPADGDGYKGVLFDDELLGARWFGMGPFFAQRIRVVLRNEDPAKSEELFHNKEQPNTVKPKLSQEALVLWIRTARARNLPAVYTTQSRIFVLPSGYYAEAESDPKAFLKKLKPYAFKGKPLPDTQAAS
ncbi:MAG: hypothetical protein AAGF14_03185 [Pseudomonadota bacterium]